MDIKIDKMERTFKFDGVEYDDPNPNISVNEAVKMLATLNPSLAVYANGHATFDKREGDKIIYIAKKAFADKG